jgi:hypothetical protein
MIISNALLQDMLRPGSDNVYHAEDLNRLLRERTSVAYTYTRLRHERDVKLKRVQVRLKKLLTHHIVRKFSHYRMSKPTTLSKLASIIF